MDEIRGALLDYAGALEKRYKELDELMGAPEILGDGKLWQKYSRERTEIEKTALLYRKYAEYKELYEAYLKESELARGEEREAFKRELSLIEEDIEELYSELTLASCTEEGESSAVIIELRSDSRQSGEFASDLIKLYRSFARDKGYDFRIKSEEAYTSGGSKEAIIEVEGAGAKDYLLHESGIHRAELAGGKSATVSVAVYGAPDERKYSIKDEDIRIDLFHSSGAGGQNINKVETAVRARHLPTGIMVVCKDERSQLMNRNRATEELKERVRAYYDNLRDELFIEGKDKAHAANYRIRLYDYPSGKLTDLRLNVTVPFKSGERTLTDLLSALRLKRY